MKLEIQHVAELCTRTMAIDRCESHSEREPLWAVDELRVRVWRRVSETEELPQLKLQRAAILTKLLAGQTLEHVFSGSSPGAGLETAEQNLEDVEFGALAGYRADRMHQPVPEAAR